ncbi:hypothetical protein [Paraliomyxa miuraensis]|uniref:hypothetical protein n=1 Tax=Paraliomyxa miuraensis TaxID=376150 RepID=UPI00224C983E|nr:hypothetical protein [Paraliomyxa miuraensis]MCX4246217.1 hypothetical protein [Paraliomyxa miuraensis]
MPLLWALASSGCMREGEEPTSKLPLGAACQQDSPPWCEGHASCFEGVCTSYTDQTAIRDARHVETIAVDMQAQSNATPDPQPGAVAIRTARGEHYHVFAACKPYERLIGGGCQTQHLHLRQSYPESTQPGDTIGGRWHCDFGLEDHVKPSRTEQTASALCQRLTMPPDAERPEATPSP